MADTIAALVQRISPITPQHTVNDVGDALLAEEYSALLSVPVVEDGRPVGVISRYHLMKVFMHRYGREIHGRKPVAQFMRPPLVVDAAQPMEEAAQHIAASVSLPLTEDFVVVEQDRYVGIGVVLDLLRAMERQAVRRNAELDKALGELKTSQTRLVQSEKMASLGQMVAGVAHEINTPLGYVRGNVENLEPVHGQAFAVLRQFDDLVGMLVSGEVDEATLNVHLQAAVEAGAALRETAPAEDIAAVFRDTVYGIDQIAELVTSLKNFSRLDQTRTASASVNDCLDAAVTIASNQIKHRAKVIKRYGEVPRIDCAPSQLNQVFLNLITNAAQAMEQPGWIALETRAEGDGVLVTVTDNGRGIPPDVLPRIFDPFFTTKPVGEGTGLGLAISWQIVEQHGGTIQVQSEPGKGTRFAIRLPGRAPATAAAPAPMLAAVNA
jgi:signal transduction histidine kinase